MQTKHLLNTHHVENPEEIRILATIAWPKLFELFSTSEKGLSATQAGINLEKYGPNQLLFEHRDILVIQFFKLLFTPLSILLIVLSALSYFTGESRGAVVIASMVFLSTLLGFVQEHKSNRAAQKLKEMVSTRATVVRDGVEFDIEITNLVPGDLIHLSVGDLIPADVRLIDSKGLFVNEGSLTGESLPVEKNHHVDIDHTTSIFEWINLCHMGSHVVSGVAHGIVLKTGKDTFFGELAKETTKQTKQSSFDQGIKKFTWLMIKFMMFMVPVVVIINGFVKGNWMEAALFAIAIAVGLAPEMLPMLVTINLAKGAIAMSKKNVIVKRLNAIQNLGAMDILCTDKTGTLTQDEIILERYVNVKGETDKQVLEFAYLNSHYQAGLKNLMDVAVLKHSDVHQKLHDLDTYKKVDEIPFDFQRRRMSVVVQKNDEQHILICKGAVEEIFTCCKYVQLENQLIKFDLAMQIELEKLVASLNSDGFRVIAVAIKNEEISSKAYEVSDELDLILLGYVAFLDPPKESAKPAIEALQGCGVSIKILTGDNELVTRKICHEVGLNVSHVVLGSSIENMSDDHLADLAQNTTVFAKMTPGQKARVIKALQMHGHVVGYMGDGINDGPSLKSADVSISVDSAVDIAKESADIILLEKSLLVLQKGVLEGRKVFGNIMKYLKMSASSNFGNMFSMLGASALLPFLPMAPVQILLNNLLYDFSQTSVPTDSVDDEYLLQPRAWDVGNIARYMFFIGPISSVFDYVTFGLAWFVLKANTPELSPIFQTAWFVESLLSQTLIVHVIRTSKIPFIESRPSGPLLVTTLGICILGVMLPYTPWGSYFEMVPLPSLYWVGLAVILPAYLLLTQFVKSHLIKRFGVI